jgi:thioredoxin-related protein
VAVLLTLYIVMTRPAPPPEDWGSDYEAALAAAATGDRKVLVAFHLSGCPPCYAMNRLVLGTQEVRAALDGYVPIQLDGHEHKELANRLGVVGAPTYVIVDAEGRVLAKCDGYHSVSAFVTFLKGSSPSPGAGTDQAEGARPDGP